jgi:hypothetical protein
VDIQLADNWLLSDLGEHGDRIIYKIVGSPFANELADRRSGIDTVVITESDHMTFLGRLENEHTKPPAPSPALPEEAPCCSSATTSMSGITG